MIGICWVTRGGAAITNHRRLPFGLQSSSWLFNQMADAVEWILRVKFGIRHVIHYLDDFLILASTSKKGQKILDTTLATLQRLGIEWAPEKVQGPAKILTFLGIEIDSYSKVLRLPQSKWEDLEAELQQWYLRKKCTKRQLLLLIGKLSFAGKLLPAGQIFIRRLIDLATTAKTLSHRVNLSQDTRANIEWWQRVLPSWPGKSYFLTTLWQLSPEMQLFIDAARSHGFGACWSRQWLCRRWLEQHQQKSFSIAWKELYAIVIAAAI